MQDEARAGRRAWVLLAALIASGVALASSPRVIEEGAWLPSGWSVLSTAAVGPSRAGRIPSLARAGGGQHGPGAAESRVLLAARSETGGALFLVRVEAPLSADVDAREALLASAPEALRDLWGVDVELRWVDLVQLGEQTTLQLQGRVRLARGVRHLRVAALPRGDHHLLLVMTWPTAGAGALEVEAERVLLALPSANPSTRTFWSASTVIGALITGLAGLLLLVVMHFRRRGSP